MQILDKKSSDSFLSLKRLHNSNLNCDKISIPDSIQLKGNETATFSLPFRFGNTKKLQQNLAAESEYRKHIRAAAKKKFQLLPPKKKFSFGILARLKG